MNNVLREVAIAAFMGRNVTARKLVLALGGTVESGEPLPEGSVFAGCDEGETLTLAHDGDTLVVDRSWWGIDGIGLTIRMNGKPISRKSPDERKTHSYFEFPGERGVREEVAREVARLNGRVS